MASQREFPMLGEHGPAPEARPGAYDDERFDPRRRPWDADERSYAGAACSAELLWLLPRGRHVAQDSRQPWATADRPGLASGAASRSTPDCCPALVSSRMLLTCRPARRRTIPGPVPRA
jgi:hypothetical protein